MKRKVDELFPLFTIIWEEDPNRHLKNPEFETENINSKPRILSASHYCSGVQKIRSWVHSNEPVTALSSQPLSYSGSLRTHTPFGRRDPRKHSDRRKLGKFWLPQAPCYKFGLIENCLESNRSTIRSRRFCLWNRASTRAASKRLKYHLQQSLTAEWNKSMDLRGPFVVNPLSRARRRDIHSYSLNHHPVIALEVVWKEWNMKELSLKIQIEVTALSSDSNVMGIVFAGLSNTLNGCVQGSKRRYARTRIRNGYIHSSEHYLWWGHAHV